MTHTGIRRNAGLRLMPSSGFTLVEVMVALTILSLVMLATVSGFRTLATTQTTLDRVVNRIDEIRTVSSFLRQVFESAIVSQGSGLSLGGHGRNGAGGTAFFDVDDRAVVLKTVVLLGEGFGGTQFVRVAQEDSAVVLRWSQDQLSAKDGRWLQNPSRKLVHEVDTFAISARARTDGRWESLWSSDTAPEAVRIVLKAHGRFFPELIVPVQR